MRSLIPALVASTVRMSLGCLVVAGVFSSGPCWGAVTTFRLYEKGIETAEYRFEQPFVSAYEYRSRDRATAEWSTSRQLPLEALGEAPTRLPGSLALLADLGPNLRSARWAKAIRVEFTAAAHKQFRFERQGARDVVVDHRGTRVYLWIQAGGGMMRYGAPPLDLLVTPSGQIVGAVDPSGDLCLVATGFESATPTYALWQSRGIPHLIHGVRKLDRAMVRMSDGVHLATDVYLPADKGVADKLPVLLVRTPYDASRAIESAWNYVARGYAVVAQDVRGRYGSEGQFLIDRFELRDGDETLTWIAAQPWSNGKVGMMGASYPGHVQWMAAYRGNPALQAIIPVSSMGTPHNDMPYTGGALDVGAAQWNVSMEGGDTHGLDWARLLSTRPFDAIVPTALGRQSALWEQISQHVLYDDYWKASDWLRYEKNIDVPALQLSGWYDDDHPGTLANWDMMARNARAGQKMILGPWRHNLNKDRDLNGVDFGPRAVRADLWVLMQQWYDHYLKGVPNGVDRRPAVEYFSVGDDRWHTADAWPPREAVEQNWYLHAPVDRSSESMSGELSPKTPGDEAPDSYLYDPTNPTPSLIDVALNEQSLPDDYASVERRPDVLVYQTGVLRKPLRIAGPLRAILYASSSARDTDWVVRLSDVDATGRVTRLVEGVLRARFRESFSEEKLLNPGKVERYQIQMRSHANTFLPGHRIRVSIASAAAGYIFPNSNTGENEATVTRTEPARQHIYHDTAHPSCIVLPMMH